MNMHNISTLCIASTVWLLRLERMSKVYTLRLVFNPPFNMLLNLRKVILLNLLVSKTMMSKLELTYSFQLFRLKYS